MNLHYLSSTDTICAPSTPPGSGAIAVIRLSGPEAIRIAGSLFEPAGDVSPEEAEPQQMHLGWFSDGENAIDEVMLTVFRSPQSFTGEDVVEISCHGSTYIQKKILETLISSGARYAEPGEFTMRGFRNGKFDLSQAEAIADLIASNSAATHQLALNQMRGGYSARISELRARLIDFASLVELELDFSEEDVEFADRQDLKNLLEKIKDEIDELKSSFAMGNVIKQGIPVAIVGKPNSGKSTLLNAILNEERALVSEIPGTTRDAIEDTISVKGVTFRFIDTAGLRHTSDQVENMGISRTVEKMNQAIIVLYVFDITTETREEINAAIDDIMIHLDDDEKMIIPIANKTDLLEEAPHSFQRLVELDTIFVSAKRNENINLIMERLLETAQLGEVGDRTIVYNLRHFDALTNAEKAILDVESGIYENRPLDLIASDIRQALHHLGTITGEVTSNEILGNIFGKFCIGK